MNLSQYLDGPKLGSVTAITDDMTFVTPYAGLYNFYCWGGGGSGGLSGYPGNSSARTGATGGGSGGFVFMQKSLAASFPIAITIGKGGSGVSSVISGSYSADGLDGGDTLLSGTGISVNAKKGYGGNGGASTSSSLSVSGSGISATPTGGDIRIAGSSSYNISATSLSGIASRATAGAPALIGQTSPLSASSTTGLEYGAREPENPSPLSSFSPTLLSFFTIYGLQTRELGAQLAMNYAFSRVHNIFGVSGAGNTTLTVGSVISASDGGLFGAGGGGCSGAYGSGGSFTLTSGRGGDGIVLVEYLG